MTRKSIYFSGSISGGREDLGYYKRIVDALQSAGHRVLAGMVTSDAVGADLDGKHASCAKRWINQQRDRHGIVQRRNPFPRNGLAPERIQLM